MLRADDFRTYFEAVHGYRPFPWQERLTCEVLATGKWPPLLDLPTASGKTATIDIAVFHLACEAEKGTERKAPMRILFVIDRRIVVDEAFCRARRIAQKLQGATDGVLLRVKERLSQLSRDCSHPLDVVRLRGGVPRERDWARSPAQPLIAISTVDQVGSRLLFRGYGVSPKMWPVHAGLVGADALWLLDEVHLSQPLVQTLEALCCGHPSDGSGFLADRPRLAPFCVVQLSATPGDAKPAAFHLSEDDQTDNTLSRRLSAQKLARLVPVSESEGLAEKFVTTALELAGLIGMPESKGRKQRERRKARASQPDESIPPVYRVAIVVNRVDLAREIFEQLQEKMAEDLDGVLLTGRVRPLDRDQLLVRLQPLLASPTRPVPDRPIILVATQTIEVGADLDVDALVTEIAPLDSLCQRFGRLDRLGLRERSRAAILLPAKDSLWQKDPWKSVRRIYGDAPKATAKFLQTLGKQKQVDFGVRASADYENRITSDHLAPRQDAPVLLPPYVDLWAATSPEAAPTPEPALFLRGPGRGDAEIQVVWRAGIALNALEPVTRWLEICPPSSLETMPVPIWAVQGWLREPGGTFTFSDIPEAPQDTQGGQPPGRPCLRRDGDGWARAYADDLRPGDIIVVPTSYGGCDEYGWNPQCQKEVTDLSVEAQYRQRRRGALYLTEATLKCAAPADDETAVTQIWSAIRDAISVGEDVNTGALLEDLIAVEGLPVTWVRLLREMRHRQPRWEFVSPDNPAEGIFVWAERPLAEGLLDSLVEDDTERGDESITDYDQSSAAATEVGLADHLDHVAAKAKEFARRAGLPCELARLVALAGRMHDLGKADPRFQADLQGQSALAHGHRELAACLAASSDKLLAKSAQTRLAHTSSAAPESFRHEALSVALAQKHPQVSTLPEHERDLVLWLVGTHHGYGRPFFPPSSDKAPATEATVPLDGVELRAAASEAPLRLDQGWLELAHRVQRTYGPWEIARLEAILRLADHAVSAAEKAEAG